MTLTSLKLMLTVLILLAACIPGIWTFYQIAKHMEIKPFSELNYPVGESLASGIFLGAGLLHMLPDAALSFTEAGYRYPFPFLMAGISFLFLLLLEHIAMALKHRYSQLVDSITLLTVTMLSIHALLEGAAVGLALSFATALLISIAILTHKGVASFALSIQLHRGHLSFTARILAFSLFAIMTPIGILCGDWILSSTPHSPLLTPIFSSLAAGTFLYIGTLHGLGRASLIRHCCNMKEFFVMLFGFSLMAVVAIWT
ncbi:MAG: hypothetical protein A3E85_00610 [Gammaproteobacteria bacterium RIFCSPHIGHO2_12_FULL_45_12]|nr:MAG: hypothetical protein A3E85_00610 [Gammaproteobacteria bacterium RIFCSPHIGHO2_12_FULL_45_12]